MANITTITNTSNTTTAIPPSKPQSNQTQEPLNTVLTTPAPQTSSFKRGTKRSKSPSSSSITSRSTTSSTNTSTTTPSPQRPRQQKKKKRTKCPQPDTSVPSLPSSPAFHGATTIIKPRDEALTYAKTVYNTQFEASGSSSTSASSSWHVFWADGSANEKLAGCSGAGVVFSVGGRIDNFVDRGYAVQDVSGVRHLEMFAIGAALRIALGRIEEMKEKGMEKKGEEKGEKKAHTHKVSVFSDSQDAIRVLGSLSDPTKESEKDEKPIGQDLALMVAGISRRLVDLGVEVEVLWVPGHAGHVAHKRVDQIAKAAARHAVFFLKGRMGRTNTDGVVQVVNSGLLKL